MFLQAYVFTLLSAMYIGDAHRRGTLTTDHTACNKTAPQTLNTRDDVTVVDDERKSRGRLHQHGRSRPRRDRSGRGYRSDLRRARQRCRPSARGREPPPQHRHPGLRARRGSCSSSRSRSRSSCPSDAAHHRSPSDGHGNPGGRRGCTTRCIPIVSEIILALDRLRDRVRGGQEVRRPELREDLRRAHHGDRGRPGRGRDQAGRGRRQARRAREAARRRPARGGPDPRGGSRAGRADRRPRCASRRRPSRPGSSSTARPRSRPSGSRPWPRCGPRSAPWRPQLAGRIVGESLEDDERSARVVDRFLADLEATERRRRKRGSLMTDARCLGRGARRPAREQLGRRSGSADAAQVGDDLFARRRRCCAPRPGLRRVPTDVSTDRTPRSALVRSLFEGKVDAISLDLVADAVRRRWTATRDLADTLEHLGEVAVVRSAGSTTPTGSPTSSSRVDAGHRGQPRPARGAVRPGPVGRRQAPAWSTGCSRARRCRRR